MTENCPVCGKGEFDEMFWKPVVVSHLDCVRKLRQVDDDNVKQLMAIKAKWAQAEAEVEQLRWELKWMERQSTGDSVSDAEAAYEESHRLHFVDSEFTAEVDGADRAVAMEVTKPATFVNTKATLKASNVREAAAFTTNQPLTAMLCSCPHCGKQAEVEHLKKQLKAVTRGCAL